MLSLLLAATLQIGVYYTFPANQNLQPSINQALKEAQNLINKAVFNGRENIILQSKFVRYWHIEHPPIYDGAVDSDQIWTDFMKLTNAKENKADVSLLLFSSDVAYFNKKLDRKKGASGLSRLDMIVLANYNPLEPATLYAVILDHELGHYLNLNHANAEECKTIYYIMCAKISSENIVFGKSLKKAWRDFYESRTGQRFEGVLSK